MARRQTTVRPLYRDADYLREATSSDDSRSHRYRSPFYRDYARLIHSAAYRRLQGKLQLYPGHESDFFRNRLTHSIEVAQIARAIAQKLNINPRGFSKSKIDIDLVTFAGMAHDLGHPPFGHTGEHALDVCMRKWGGFEGNAQTLRILARLEKKEALDDAWETQGFSHEGVDLRVGLNLTSRTLASVLKYDERIPRTRPAPLRPADARPQKGYYASEADLVQQIKRNVGSGYSPPKGAKWKTVECQIMDIADDIAYSTYDLEDGLKCGLLSPLRMLGSFKSDESLQKAVMAEVVHKCPGATADGVFDALKSLFGADVFDGLEGATTLDLAIRANVAFTEVAENGYLRRDFTAYLVDQFVDAVECKFDAANPLFSSVQLASDALLCVESLKHLNYQLVIQSPQLKRIAFRGARLVTQIFEALEKDRGTELLPYDFRQMLALAGRDKMMRHRIICDFIAGMTDRYAIDFYGRLTDGRGSMFTPL